MPLQDYGYGAGVNEKRFQHGPLLEPQITRAKRLDNKRPLVSNLRLCTANMVPARQLRSISAVLQSFPEADQKAPVVPTVNGGDALDRVQVPIMRPISQEQLVAEIEGIYTDLIMVEAKCIKEDNKQVEIAQQSYPAPPPKLNNKQGQALMALHRTLLHEHYDFFLASQHPSASPALRRLASIYAMPARMWRYGIHSFLELLRHRLPASLDHILAFIYVAYSMMALLYETVPTFENTWIECLGDLGRYRVAIEDETDHVDIRDRDIWTGVARHWYSKASYKTPSTGRLYHHLAILARPNALLQLFYYTKSLCVAAPFLSTRESIQTLFEPVLQGQHRLMPFVAAFVKAHGLLFTNKNMVEFRPIAQEFLDLLYDHIRRVSRKFLEQGYYIAISNIVAILGYGSQDNPLMIAIQDAPQDASDSNAIVEIDKRAMQSFQEALYLTTEAIKIVLKRIGDPNILPFIHVTLIFINYISCRPRAIQYLEASFPWQPLVETLNLFLATYTTRDQVEDGVFPLSVKGDILAEDFAMRGLTWVEGYYPPTWFSDDKLEEKHLKVASTADMRKERILWIAHRIANNRSWLFYDTASRRFSTTFMEVPLELTTKIDTSHSSVT